MLFYNNPNDCDITEFSFLGMPNEYHYHYAMESNEEALTFIKQHEKSVKMIDPHVDFYASKENVVIISTDRKCLEAILWTLNMPFTPS